MGDVQKARVVIGLGDDLPGVTRNPGYGSFDISSDFLRQMSKNSDQNPPQSVDFESLEGAFTVAFPSKGLHRINNYISGDKQWDVPQTQRKIVWTPTQDRLATNTVLKCYLDTADSTMYTLLQPSADYSTNTSYAGPRWWTRPDTMGRKRDPASVDADDQISTDASTKNYSTTIEQYQVTPEMWWGITTSLPSPIKQTGIWLTVKLGGERKVNKASFLAITINPPGQGATGGNQPQGQGSTPTMPTDAFSIVIDEQGCYLVDYFDPYAQGITTPSNALKDWNKVELNGIKTISGASSVQIGILPMIGYLAVYINGTSNIYPRRNKTDPTTFDHFVMAIANVFVHGRNAPVEIDMSAMIFSETAKLSPPVINTVGVNSVRWEGSKTGPHSTVPGAGIGSAMCLYPGPSNGKISCGVCCKDYTDPSGSVTAPSGSATDAETVKMCPGPEALGSIKVEFVSSEDTNIETMQITMGTEMKNCFNSSLPLPVGPPYLFRLRANKANPVRAGESITADMTDVISMTESWDSPDYVHITHSVDITMYNPGGRYNDLLTKSMGIIVEAHLSGLIVGGGSSARRIFTGITLDSSISEVAGKETISFHCKDYMELLEMTMFLNCPYYDGMWDINAAMDIASRAGVEVANDTGVTIGSTNGYFLPAGYSFAEPKMKWSSDTNLKDGILNVLKLGEKICFFDENGVLRIDNLQGGLAFSGAGVTSSASFRRDPSGSDFNVILDEKREEHLVGSTVDRVFVTSWDRVAGSVIAYQDVNPVPNVPYAKTLYYDQPAFGSAAAVQEWVNMIKQRVFKIPKRITFKTLQNDFSLRPLKFIDVEGKMYRIKSLNRRFDADSNSITTDITGEWYGT
jgi:hypothetical protein